MGWLMDRWGVRFGLSARFYGGLLQPARKRYKSGLQLGITRFWMGTGECGNYSGGLKAILEHLPRVSGHSRLASSIAEA